MGSLNEELSWITEEMDELVMRLLESRNMYDEQDVVPVDEEADREITEALGFLLKAHSSLVSGALRVGRECRALAV